MLRGLWSAAIAASIYIGLAKADAVSRCSINNVCFQVGVPEASVSSNSGNIYMQLRAPTSYSWVAFGTGQSMSGSNVFALYTDGAGNVTISARKSTGHSEPKHQTTTQLELLAGSGVIDNGQTMLANVRCSNCETWDGGSLSLSSTSSPFIAAWKKGSALNTKKLDASLAQHDSHDRFTFDLTQATIANDQNPFVSSDNTVNATLPGANHGGSGSGSGSGSSLSGIPTLISAHGIIMSIVMVVLYPIGAILMPMFGKWALHAAWQTVAFVGMWAGFGIGIILAQRIGLNLSEGHLKFGTIIVALLGIQPIIGYLHHLHYLKHQKRGFVSYAHIWYGRILMVLGVINGGLGLKLARAYTSLVTAYSVIAAIIFIVYIGGAAIAEAKRHRQAALGEQRSKGPRA